MGRVCSVLRPVVTLQSFKMIGRPEVRLLGVVHDLAAICEKIVKNWHQPVKWTFFRPKVDFNDFWPAKSIQRVNIYVSGEFEENRSRSHFSPIT